jgi:hypothetical protein
MPNYNINTTRINHILIQLLLALSLSGCQSFNALTDTTKEDLIEDENCLVYLNLELQYNDEVVAPLESNWENIETGELVKFLGGETFHLIQPGTYLLRDFKTPREVNRKQYYMIGLGDNGLKFEAPKSKAIYTGDVLFDIRKGYLAKDIAKVSDNYSGFYRILNKKNPDLINYSHKSIIQNLAPKSNQQQK